MSTQVAVFGRDNGSIGVKLECSRRRRKSPARACRAAAAAAASVIAAAAVHMTASPPLNHVFFLLADDWGSYDAGFRIRELGRQPDLRTPAIDALAADGLTFSNYYVQPICSPTRASLLSGRYSIHTGSEHKLFGASEPSCLPTEFPLMPRAFKSLGYQVHGIGKWHLGYVNDTCAPWGRGFDSYIGYMNGNEGYFQHGISSGKDWHLCTDTANASACDVCSPKYDGRYSTHVYAERAVGLVQKWRRGDPPLFVYLAWQAVHEPMEAPPEYIKPFEAIEDRSRRVYAAMLLALDEGIGNLTMALGASPVGDNSVFVLSNDNGGMSGSYGMGCCQCGTSCGGLNYPYRGWKDSYWEGGFRGIGLIHSPKLLRTTAVTMRKYSPLLWVGDWYKTLLSAALEGANATTREKAAALLKPLLASGPVDSVDHWSALKEAAMGLPPPNPPPREEIVLAGIDIDKKGATIRRGPYKLLLGSWGSGKHCDLNISGYSPVYPVPPAPPEQKGGEGGVWCTQLTRKDAEEEDDAVAPPWWERVAGLYNVESDPREVHDLKATLPEVVKELKARLAFWNSTTAATIHLPNDPAGKAHANSTGCWGPWR